MQNTGYLNSINDEFDHGLEKYVEDNRRPLEQSNYRQTYLGTLAGINRMVDSFTRGGSKGCCRKQLCHLFKVVLSRKCCRKLYFPLRERPHSQSVPKSLSCGRSVQLFNCPSVQRGLPLLQFPLRTNRLIELEAI